MSGCPKCGGLLYTVRLWDRLGIAKYEYAQNCISCGNIISPEILENRHKVIPIHQRGRGRNKRGMFVKEI